MRTNRAFALSAVAALAFAAVPAYSLPVNPLHRIWHHTAKMDTARQEPAQMFRDLEAQSYELNDHALTLRAAATINSASADFYSGELEAVRESLNRMGRALPALEKADSGRGIEPQAVARIRPQLAAIASTLRTEVRFLREQPDRMETPQFHGLSMTLSNQTQNLWQMLHDAVKLTDVRARERHLRQELDQTEHKG